MERYYPPIASNLLENLNTVRLHLIEDSSYLDAAECPYPEDTRRRIGALFGALFGGAGFPANGPDASLFEGNEDLPDLDLEKEAKILYRQLKKFGETSDKLTASEQAAYYRIAVSQLDKLVSIDERATNLKNFKTLMDFILQFIEDEMDPDQRTKFMEHIRDFNHD